MASVRNAVYRRVVGVGQGAGSRGGAGRCGAPVSVKHVSELRVAIVPSAPVLVPELAAAAAAELTDLRGAMRDAVADLPQRWIAVGVAGVESVVAPAAAGTFAGYGVDVPVALSPGAHEVSDLPLCALMAGWLRGQDRPDASVETRCYPATLDNGTAVRRGAELRAEIGDTEVGVLVVADGANTLTPPAPGGYDPDSLPVQAALDDALGAGDAAALTQLPDTVVGRPAFAVLSGLAGAAAVAARELYRGAPYGVGYFAGVWRI